MRVLAAERDDGQRSFGGVVVDLELAIVDVWGERRPARGPRGQVFVCGVERASALNLPRKSGHNC